MKTWTPEEEERIRHYLDWLAGKAFAAYSGCIAAGIAHPEKLPELIEAAKLILTTHNSTNAVALAEAISACRAVTGEKETT